ncbi:hypothetical protein BDA99DRAFT_538059 [Phascolomyces articulosus]|uniref:MHYT domain-containing protein n=1 Tax=Phascolomyces articulosus TaxID=60185 RepID=A0AAD5PDT9_9FUNG|nr:hypothetical protein BDA99DRAFT_538059 [Phascolomyces articulosus]
MVDVFVQQYFNAGIIVTSYIIAVIGAMTTLELLTQRTHYKGSYNWFLLLAAAFCMGGVAIWSMHFIGNNCLTLTIPDDEGTYQLAYGPGFTFASLVVSIFCMFLSFAFVGVTEEAKLTRIVPSGVLAGSGIALMHYIGQFAVKFFIPRYKVPYVVGAIVIAISAVTVALYIFFKLREQWANQWYKRLGCAMLMGVAVCGMHYTAMAGTEYIVPSDAAVAPVPALSIAAMIGIVSGVVVIGCAILLYIVVFRQRGYQSSRSTIATSIQTEKIRRRLVLNSVIFDNKGKILVRVDGVLPMRTVMYDMSSHVTGPFSVSHPLFFRFFEATTQWSRHPNIESYNDPILQQYLEAAQELAEELKLGPVSNLGILFDSVLHAQTPVQKKGRRFFPSVMKRTPSATIRLLSKRGQPSPSRPSTPAHTSMQMLFAESDNIPSSSAASTNIPATTATTTTTTAAASTSVTQNQQPLPATPGAVTSSGEFTHYDVELGVPISSSNNGDTSQDEKQPTNVSTPGLGNGHSDTDDEHILLVRNIGHDKDLIVKLLSQGFRFADPVFIARIMGAKLNLSAEHMLSYFRDMQSMVESTHMTMPRSAKCSVENNGPTTSAGPGGAPISSNNTTNQQQQQNNSTNLSPGTPPQSPSSSVSSTRSLSMPFSNKQLQGGVYVGLLALVEEKQPNHHQSPHHQPPQPPMVDLSAIGTNGLEILVDKNRHFSFPVVPLRYEDDQQHVIQLGREEKSCVYNLQGQSMLAVSMLDSQLPHETTSTDSAQSTSPMLQHYHQQHHRNNSSGNNSNHTTNTISNAHMAAVTSSLFSPATIMAGIGAPSPAQQTAQIRRFIKALGTACRSLVQTSNYGKLLGTGARLHAEVLEIPPFTLIPGPCELILFRTLITIPGTRTAINQTPTEPMKCVPLKLYKSFAYHVTDQAIELYRQTNLLKRSGTQQSAPTGILPSSGGGVGGRHASNRKKFPQIMENGTTSLVETFSGKRYNITNSTRSLPMSSATSSSNGSSTPRGQASAVELPIMVNLMPTQARFLWLDLMIEETIQANKTNHHHHRR